MSDKVVPLHDGIAHPGHDMADRVQERMTPLSPWGRTAASGQPLGKKVIINYDADDTIAQPAAVPIFELRGADMDACQLMVTLTSPRAIPRAAADIGIDIQNQTGEFGYREVGSANYPGSGAPIVWPPFIAVLKWGTGGARAFAEVDFVNGMTVNVPCSSVDLSAAVAADAINAPGTSGLYTLSAFVTPGWPRPGAAQRTVNLGALANAGESNLFPIPPFAKDVTLVGCDESAGIPSVAVAYIRFWQGASGLAATNIGNYLINANQPIPFRVPNGAAYFTVVSGTSPTQRFAAIFGLSI